MDMQQIGHDAKRSARTLRPFTTEQKNALLHTIADALETNAEHILAENAKDVADAEAKGLTYALVDRLNLGVKNRLQSMIDDVRNVASLPDPVGEEYDTRELENGLRLRRRRVPLGVLGVIYESRPNVTVDIATLALKTGNAVILRGGSETLRSNIALVDIVQQAMADAGFPEKAVQLIRDTDRKYVSELLRLDRYVDMIIPRGGAKLHRLCLEESTIPVITGGMGICHLYVDDTADLDAALEVIYNAKTQKPSACNSISTLLLQREIANDFLPRVVNRLQDKDVTFKLDDNLTNHIKGDPKVEAAQEGDWDIEWLDFILGIKVVDTLDEVIDHIELHGTAHSDGILTQDETKAKTFLDLVDSAAVYWNASTRFTDGSAFGLGAEVAVSTQKLHGRGPLALEALTTYKWVVEGDYHVRA